MEKQNAFSSVSDLKVNLHDLITEHEICKQKIASSVWTYEFIVSKNESMSLEGCWGEKMKSLNWKVQISGLKIKN